ncbi:ferric-chelate reductase [Lojkania enalia]|uniref:Ferric-chelate reductase n=1 Tax=Lojkania enalia TaxID=147567 RepID=A0A9P4N4U1_9PLEO|nr:ferric-chelate reductase [Didymosphaeria enalia]
MVVLYLGLLCLASSATASGPVPVTRSGLAGIGFNFYDPYCAHGCFRSFSGFTLPCSTIISAGGHTTADEAAYHLAKCRASDFPFLSSIAWCIHLYCPEDVRASKIENFWETGITGDVTILPKWSYGEMMANITQPPTMVAMTEEMRGGKVLNMTMLTTYNNWKATQDTLVYFFRETAQESYYGLSICLTAFALPIVLTWLGYLPFMTSALERIKPWLYPSVIGTYHDRPLPFSLGNAPTVGQSFYIAIMVILNIVFLAVGYKTLWPDQIMQWYTNRYQELMAYFMWRTGVLAFCNMPVLFLFSSRNNILLWLTNWSHSTYMLLHRWIARLFLIQTLLHSILALVLYQNTGSYGESLKKQWWIWGCVATVAAVIIVLASVLILRQRAYELFLITHIVMAVICVVGCWYHIYIGYENTFGYETWLYATIAVWFFDRVARVARILKTGLRRSKVTEVGSNILRVDIEGIRWRMPGHHVYVYFPTLSPFRPWENHPFSMIPTTMLTGHRYSDQAGLELDDIEKNAVTVGSNSVTNGKIYTNSGLTLFIRNHTGMTGSLKSHNGLLTLLEGPYPNNPTKAVLQSDRLLLIGGGIGITGLLPFLRCHANFKLFYSVKGGDLCLVETLSAVLNEVQEKDISVGRRLDIHALLREEAGVGWSKIAVVVCGPATMCDDVRAAVALVGKEEAGSCSFELEVDAFSW